VGARVLVLAIRAIGDTVLITPVIRLLRERVPASYLAVVADGVSADVLRHNPHIDRVVAIDRAASRRLPWFRRCMERLDLTLDLRAQRFDIVVDLFSGPRSASMAWLSGARARYGEDYRNRARGFFYTHPIKIVRHGRHLIDQKLDLIQPLTGETDRGGVPLEVTVTELEREQAHFTLVQHGVSQGLRVALVPGGKPFHLWPEERFAAVADSLVKDYGAQIIFFGSGNDIPMCQRVSALMKSKSLNLAGRTSLRELIALLEAMDLVISNETGPMHLAVATGKPKVIALYGAADIVQYAPWGATSFMLTKGSRDEAYWDRVDYEQDSMKYLMQISTGEVCELAKTVLGHRV